MTSLYAANRSAIAGTTLAGLLGDVVSADIRVQEGSNGPTVLAHTADDRWIHLHSGRDPQLEADRLVEGVFAAAEPATLIVIGLGLGYVLDAIERRSARTTVLALEPLPSTLVPMLQRRDWTEWFAGGRLTLLAGPDYGGSAEAFRVMDCSGAPPAILVHPALKREFPAATARALAVADSVVAGARANAEARRRFAGPYLVNTLKNLPVIASEGDAAGLFGRFADVPGVVIAAGPSLDANLDGLRRIQDRSLLVAVDTALRPLLAAGISPHLVVMVDPQELNSQHLRDLPDAGDSWLVAEGSVDPATFPGFAGRTFCFKVSEHQPWPWLRNVGLERGTLKAWGSVVTTAFDLACRLGCNPVVFAGTDLAYTDGLMYCRNTIYEPGWSQWPTATARAAGLKERLKQCATAEGPDVRGNPAATSAVFIQFRDWIVARTAAESGRRILNATGAGILCGGQIEQADLASLQLPTPGGTSPDLLRTVADAWRQSRPPQGDGPPPAALPRRLQEAIVGVLTTWPDDPASEPLGSFRRFAAESVPASTLRKALFDGLPVESQRPVVAALRSWVNVHPLDGESRTLWNLIRRAGPRTLDRISPTFDSPVRWPAPEAWEASRAVSDPHDPPGLAATAASVTDAHATRDFRSAWYAHLNSRRLEHLASLGFDLHAKTVLEVGAGEGDLTTFFTARECAVLATDGRAENVEKIRARYLHHPFVRAAELCLDPPAERPVGVFDVVFCYGVLHQLSEPDEALAYLAACCSGILLIETLVHNEADQAARVSDMDPRVPTASVAGVLTQPGRQWVYEQLRGLFPHVYVPLAQPNHDRFPCDWSRPVPDGSRAVFVASRTALDLPGVVEGLPIRQRRH